MSSQKVEPFTPLNTHGGVSCLDDDCGGGGRDELDVVADGNR